MYHFFYIKLTPILQSLFNIKTALALARGIAMDFLNNYYSFIANADQKFDKRWFINDERAMRKRNAPNIDKFTRTTVDGSFHVLNIAQ